MSAIPHDDHLDSSPALLAAPYTWIASRARALDSDVFEARLLLQPTICMTGPAAAQLFYDASRFQREGAAPEPLRATLLGRETLQNLDGQAHLTRKQLFMQLLSPDRVQDLVRLAESDWIALLRYWRATGETRPVYDAACEVLARAVCTWAGVPVPDEEFAVRLQQLRLLFEETANSLGGHLQARVARQQVETWLAGLIEQQRSGAGVLPRDSAAWLLALELRHADGQRVSADVAAQELLNLLRPTVAVAVYITFAVHAVHQHPGYHSWIVSDTARATAFINEVRRFYPFFPAVVARTRCAFTWQGLEFAADRRVMLDLHGTNHDPRSWPDAELFRPERFLEQSPGPWDFVPQGGGDAATTHRCPGETTAIALTHSALSLLLAPPGYRVPPQDMGLDLNRLPALPRSGMLIEPRPNSRPL